MNTQTQTPPQSIHELYTFYLSPSHVDKPRTVTIANAEIKMIFNSIMNKEKPEIILHFSDARRSLKCNKTQTEAMWDITSTDDHTKWAGVRVTLSTAKTKSGKITIVISKPTE